jgi:hypothetical protein
MKKMNFPLFNNKENEEKKIFNLFKIENLRKFKINLFISTSI